jgi:alkanesulfonate monooxygenase SsuD/methylene tetrahydromethanopterin reductase-like flavin-dependent oxidoreductase (luciferase family)
VHHHGAHYTVDGIGFLPRPVQRPGVPVWAAGVASSVKPLRRAARYRGFFPVNLGHPDQLAEAVAAIGIGPALDVRPAGQARRRPTGAAAPSGGEVGVKQAVDQDLAFGDGLDP